MDFLFPFHPCLVHYPIALSLVGAVFILLGLLRRQDQWLGYGRISLLLGWFGILAAVASGLIDQSHAPNDPQVTAVINQHITTGIALLVVFGLAIYWPLRDRTLLNAPRRRWAYLMLLGLGIVLLLLEGWFGGKLVYQLGVGVR